MGPSLRVTNTKGVIWWATPTETIGRPFSTLANTLSVPPDRPKVSAPLAGGLLAHRVRRPVDGACATGSGGLHLQLDAGRALEVVEKHEGLGRRAAHGQQAVVAHQHDGMRAEVAHQPLLLVEVDRDAF